VKGINLNHLMDNKPGQTDLLSLQKSNFLKFNQIKNNDFENYLKNAEFQYLTHQENSYSKNSFGSKENTEYYKSLSENKLDDSNKLETSNNIEKDLKKDVNNDKNINDTKLEDSTDKSFDTIKKKIADELKELEDEKSKPRDVKENANLKNLINILQQLFDKINGKIPVQSKEKLEETLNSLKEINNNLNKLGKNKILKELKSIFSKLEGIMSSINDQKDSMVNGNNNLSKKALIDVLTDLKKLFEKKVHVIDNSISATDSDKISDKMLIQSGIQLVNGNDKHKSRVADENNAKNAIETKSVDQKTDVKLENLTNTGDGSKSGFADSNGKTSIHTKEFVLPKGSNIKNPADLFNQVVSKATMSLNNNRNEMEIRLEPRIMGNVNLKIVVEGGVVSGRFLVENEMVKKFFEDNMNMLKTSLEDQGLKFDEVNVFLDNRNNNSYFGNENYSNELNRASAIRINESKSMTEEKLTDRYMSPDWLATEVNLVI